MLNQACFSLFVELLSFTQFHVKERESCTAIQSYAKNAEGVLVEVLWKLIDMHLRLMLSSFHRGKKES